jgi:hypothetical protein
VIYEDLLFASQQQVKFNWIKVFYFFQNLLVVFPVIGFDALLGLTIILLREKLHVCAQCNSLVANITSAPNRLFKLG